MSKIDKHELEPWPLHPLPEPSDDDGTFRETAEALMRESDIDEVIMGLKVFVTLFQVKVIAGQKLRDGGTSEGATIGDVLTTLGVKLHNG